MRGHYILIVLLLLAFVGLLVYSGVYIVDFREIAIVKTFGRAAEPIYGDREQAGLRFKWPWPVQQLVKYDARTQLLEDTHENVQTKDKQSVIVTVYCGWRIADGKADVFHRKVETMEKAEDLLRTLVRTSKSEVLGQHPMADLVNTDPKEMKIRGIEDEILERVRKVSESQYGVDVVTIGIKSLQLPEKVTAAVIKNMVAERERIAAKERQRGESEATRIIEQAQADREAILAFADRKAEQIRNEGKRVAAELLKAFQDDEDFAMWLRENEFLVKTLGDQTQFILNEDFHRSLGRFRHGPTGAEGAEAVPVPPEVQRVPAAPGPTTRPAPAETSPGGSR